MALHWIRATVAAATLAIGAGVLAAPMAYAAANPCKSQPSSAACKKQQASAKSTGAKKTETKSASKKASTAKSESKAAAKSSSKTASAKSGARSATKTSGKSSAKSSSKSAAKSSAKSSRTAKASAKTTAAQKRSAKAAARERSRAAARKVVSDPTVLAAVSDPREDIAALRSSTAYVQDLETSDVLFAKNENVVRPIASISKLMTALVVVDANLPMDEVLQISEEDVDVLKHSSSRLDVGTQLTRGDMLHLALMSSENRAAHALARHYPGGLSAFVAAMNQKAQALGMTSTHFVEPTGLSSENVSSPRDLARMVRAASQRPLIHRYSTDTEYEVEVKTRTQTFRNTNLLVRKPDWDIKVSKTGYISEAGECLVMMARIDGRDLAIVLLDSQGKLSRIGDAVRIRRILQNQVAML